MSVLLLSYWDNGQQLQLLAEALREYTDFDVLHLSVNKTYLYDSADMYLKDVDTQMKLFELRDLVKDIDFFIFSEFLPHALEMKNVLELLEISGKPRANNTIIRTAGSVVRKQHEKYLLAWIRSGWIFAGPYNDWSLSSGVGRMAHVDYICPIDKIPESKPVKDKIRICFAPTKKEKGVEQYLRVMDNLTKKYDNVEAKPITGQSWKESIKLKATCNITFDQFMLTSFANSSIESMWLKHAVLSKISSWCRAFYPDLPIITVNNEDELETELGYLIDNPDVIDKFGEAGKEHVLKHHTPERVAKQWENLINHVRGY